MGEVEESRFANFMGATIDEMEKLMLKFLVLKVADTMEKVFMVRMVFYEVWRVWQRGVNDWNNGRG